MTVKARIKSGCVCTHCKKQIKSVSTVVKGVKKELPVDDDGIFDLTISDEEFSKFDFTIEGQDNTFFDPLLDVICECGNVETLDLFDDTEPL